MSFNSSSMVSEKEINMRTSSKYRLMHDLSGYNKNNKMIIHLMNKAKNNKKISVNFRNIVNDTSSREYTHRLHRYPAKLIPHIPRFFLRNDVLVQPECTVLDPFCGTGTVLLESLLAGKNSVGIEINPVSRLIAKVKTTPVSNNVLIDGFNKICKNIRTKSTTNLVNFHNINYWFTVKTIKDLSLVKTAIEESDLNTDVRDFFLVCFSSTIRKVSNADPSINQPVFSKKMRKNTHPSINVLKIFANEVNVNMDKMSEFFLMYENNVKSTLIGNDVRKVDLRRRVDMIVTSPPYLSAHEYFRSTRLEFFWLGFDKKFNFRELMNANVGVEGIRHTSNQIELPETNIRIIDSLITKIEKKSKTRAYLAARYFYDMKNILEKMNMILRDGGHFVLVIGNNKICNIKIPSNDFISKIATDCGFEVIFELVDTIKSRGLMTRRNNTSNVISSESVFLMKK